MTTATPAWAKTLARKRAVSEDGTGISYEVLGEGSRVLLIANGLGGRLYAWEPLIEACWRDYRLVTWDYRGLFDSDTPAHPKRLAITNHAEDGLAILRAEGVSRAVLMGWSMGVQVSLELAATAPELVAGTVLLNGTYGHVLSTGFQPVFSVPFLPKRVHAFLEWLQRHPNASERLAMLARVAELPTGALLALLGGGQTAAFRAMVRQYFSDVLGPSFQNYLRLFQELDAHSVYHLLPRISAPALVISGALDPLTPAYQSREIARRMPNAEYISLLRASHFALMERPNDVVPAVLRFLLGRASW